MKRILLIVGLVLLVACVPQQMDLRGTLQYLDSQDPLYNTNWRADTFETEASIAQLEDLAEVIQNKTFELNQSNQPQLMLLIASRGLMALAQEQYQRAQAYGDESIAEIARSNDDVDFFAGVSATVACEKLSLYEAAGERYEAAFDFAIRSANAFSEAQKLSDANELVLIGVPEFYKAEEELKRIQEIIRDNKKAPDLCD